MSNSKQRPSLVGSIKPRSPEEFLMGAPNPVPAGSGEANTASPLTGASGGTIALHLAAEAIAPQPIAVPLAKTKYTLTIDTMLHRRLKLIAQLTGRRMDEITVEALREKLDQIMASLPRDITI